MVYHLDRKSVEIIVGGKERIMVGILILNRNKFRESKMGLMGALVGRKEKG